MRARSAADVALPDLAGQASGWPLHALLCGPAQDAIPIYYTCAGPKNVS